MIALLEGAMREPVERRLAAILAADVVAYSRLMGADEEGTLERLKSIRRQLIDPKIREHRGRIVKTTGDGVLAEFPSVVDAVRCAVELQRAMVDRNAQIPGDKRIIFRIGINLGDADAARLGQSLQPRRDVDAVAVDVVPVADNASRA
jgi:class 3 adenylate cyclase